MSDSPYDAGAGGLSSLPDEDDFTHYFNATARSRENRELLAKLDSWQKAHAGVMRERDEYERLFAAANAKAIRFDLDQAGIAAREREAVELVELRALVATLTRERDEARRAYNEGTGRVRMARHDARAAAIQDAVDTRPPRSAGNPPNGLWQYPLGWDDAVTAYAAALEALR